LIPRIRHEPAAKLQVRAGALVEHARGAAADLAQMHVAEIPLASAAPRTVDRDPEPGVTHARGNGDAAAQRLRSLGVGRGARALDPVRIGKGGRAREVRYKG